MKTNWKLLTDTRSWLLRYWDITAVVLLIFLLIQQTTGLIEGARLEVWRWYFISLLPGLMLLHYSAWSQRHTDRIISRGAYQAAYGISIAYWGLLFATFFLSRAAIDRNDYGFSEYFTRLLWIALPFNLLLCIGYYLLFYKREPLFKPSSAALMEVADQKSAMAQKEKNEVQYACYDAIRTNDFDALFLQLKEAFDKRQFWGYDSMLILQGQYNHLKEAMRLQTMDETEARIQLNRITLALIDLISDIKN